MSRVQAQALATKKKRDRLIRNNTPYPCSKCQEEKTPDTFVIQYIDNPSVGKYRYLYECKDCKKKRIYASRNKKRKTIEGSIAIIIQQLQQNAKKRNIPFTLTSEDLLTLWEQQSGLCSYTGIAMTYNFVGYTSGTWTEKTKYQVSCDRKNNTIGYTLGNCVLCCTFINNMKGQLSTDDFLSTCALIIQHTQQKNGN